MDQNKGSGPPSLRQKNLNLEAFRGVLALMVLFSHVELIKFYFLRPNNHVTPIMYHLGKTGVTGFFVLSGYLITFTILTRRQSNNWNIGQFYLRRICRIWPLYYFIVLLALWVLPHVGALKFTLPSDLIDVRTHSSYYLYYLFFLPQVPLCNMALLPFAEPTWSIGVEELFYLVIPFALVFVKKNLPQKLIFFILGFIAVKYTLILGFKVPDTSFLGGVLLLHRYDSVALGCLLGALHFQKHKIFNTIRSWHLLLAVIGIFVLLKKTPYQHSDYFPFALCFAVIIIFFATRPKGLLSFFPMVYLGKISFSLYLVHELAIVYIINLNIDQKNNGLLYLLSMLGAIALASVLYFLIEKPFIDLGNPDSALRKRLKNIRT